MYVCLSICLSVFPLKYVCVEMVSQHKNVSNLNIQEFEFRGIVSKSEWKDKEGVDVISVCHNKMVGMKTYIFLDKKETKKCV